MVYTNMLLNQYKLILIIYLLAKQQSSNLFALPASLSLSIYLFLTLRFCLCGLRTRIALLIGERENRPGTAEVEEEV